MDDDEIVAEFVVEAHEYLDQLDRDLVSLAQEPHTPDLLSRIFRAVHTVKGTSGCLSFTRVEELAHAGETLLALLRDDHDAAPEGAAAALVQMADTMHRLLELIETTGSDLGDAVDVASAVAALGEVLTSTEAAPPTDGRVPGPPLGKVLVELGIVTPEEVGQALAEQLRGDDRPLGELLVAAGHAEADDVRRALTAIADGSAVDADAGPDGGSTSARRTAESTVRVDVELLDVIAHLVEELATNREHLRDRAELLKDPELTRTSQRISLLADDLRSLVRQTRMQPIGQVWAKMPRIVRDLALQLGRKVSLEMEGHDTELDRSLLEALKGPLTHLVRNALDHGIEAPTVRVAAGKAEEGRLELRAYHESGQVVVEISDDGRGIDLDRVGEVAVARGVVTAEELRRMEPREVQQLVFRPGFTTAAEITNVSGRGVGMDVVRTNIERIGGSVDLTSTPGQGTTCRVRVPVSPCGRPESRRAGRGAAA